MESHRNPSNSTKIHGIPPSSVEISGRCTLFLCYSQEGIKSWNFRSDPNVVVYILKNLVNLYDSNGVIVILISTLRDEKWNLLIFCLPIFPQNPLNVLGHIICRWKDIFKENTAPSE